MNQTIKHPLSVEVERVGASYMLSFSFIDKEPLLIETAFIAGNIFINDSVKFGFDAPETFETYFGCNIDHVDMTDIGNSRIYIDIYVKTD